MKRVSILVMILSIILGINKLALANPESENSSDKWLIYWYISGNDLESNLDVAAATEDLQEMVNQKFVSFEDESTGGKVNLPIYINHDVKISPNVKILVQTGGCKEWLTEEIPGNTIGRYLYDSNGFHYQGSFADADMGDPKTFEDFLRFGKNVIEKDFQPDHRMLIFWNHGGLVGVCYDQRYIQEETDTESFLDLNDIHKTFSKVYKAMPDNPPFDIIGFDACVRATYENANNLYGFTKYMIASEENESLSGWYYSDWIKEFSNNPSITSKDLSKIICQSSFDFLDEVNASEATFSAIELSPEKWLPLRKAYNAYKNYLKSIKKDPYIYTTLEAAAANAEHYAEEEMNGLVSEPGLMIDLKGLAEETKARMTYDVKPSIRNLLNKSADDLIKAVDSAVVYNVSGRNRAYSNGISIYYPLSKNEDEFKLYASQSIVSGHTKELYENLIKLSSQLDRNSNNSEDERKANTRKRSSGRNLNEIFDLSDLQNLEVKIDEDNDKVSIELSKEQMKKVSSIVCSVAMSVEEVEGGNPKFGIKGDGAVFLGTSSDITAELIDDKKYRFTDNFEASWPMLNNHIICSIAMETRNDQLDENGEIIKKGYTIYGIPVILNDSPCLLRVAYYPSEQRYQLIGARRNSKRGIGRTSRGFIELKKGDVVTPLFTALVPAEDNYNPDSIIATLNISEYKIAFVMVKGETFALEEEPIITNDRSLEDGDYFYNFQFYSPSGNIAQSDFARFAIFDGEILYSEKAFEDSSEDDDEEIKIEIDGEEYNYDPVTHEITD